MSVKTYIKKIGYLKLPFSPEIFTRLFLGILSKVLLGRLSVTLLGMVEVVYLEYGTEVSNILLGTMVFTLIGRH